MTPKQKEWIDNASYQSLLQKQRFAPSGDPVFQDKEAWEYFSARMGKLKSEDPAAAVRASKNLGW
jgi:hypothetical protein